MAKFLNDRGEELEVNPTRTEVEVDVENSGDFSGSNARFLSSSVKTRLENGKAERTEKIVCEAEDENEFECEILVNRVRGEREDRQIIQNGVLSIEHLNEVKISGVDAEIKDNIVEVNKRGR
jgi:hypothetical protein